MFELIIFFVNKSFLPTMSHGKCSLFMVVLVAMLIIISLKLDNCWGLQFFAAAAEWIIIAWLNMNFSRKYAIDSNLKVNKSEWLPFQLPQLQKCLPHMSMFLSRYLQRQTNESLREEASGRNATARDSSENARSQNVSQSKWMLDLSPEFFINCGDSWIWRFGVSQCRCSSS